MLSDTAAIQVNKVLLSASMRTATADPEITIRSGGPAPLEGTQPPAKPSALGRHEVRTPFARTIPDRRVHRHGRVSGGPGGYRPHCAASVRRGYRSPFGPWQP